MKLAKFQQPEFTASGARRASVDLERLETVWFNTGTLCNIECTNCYIESSPSNDRLDYLTVREVRSYLDEIGTAALPVETIGFTGGEPFLNPDFLAMVTEALERGFAVLVLTNAMRPMRRPRVSRGLLELRHRFGSRLTLRVSIDHYTRKLHEGERGPGSWAAALEGARWLSRRGFSLAIAARSGNGESECAIRTGFGRLFAREGIDVDADDPGDLVIFPELDAKADAPEITVDCWKALDVRPSAMMCATSRMVVKRRNTAKPVVVSCTLLPYAPGFELGSSLVGSDGRVWLNHPHCAKFCVLGGGSCSSG